MRTRPEAVRVFLAEAPLIEAALSIGHNSETISKLGIKQSKGHKVFREHHPVDEGYHDYVRFVVDRDDLLDGRQYVAVAKHPTLGHTTPLTAVDVRKAIAVDPSCWQPVYCCDEPCDEPCDKQTVCPSGEPSEVADAAEAAVNAAGIPAPADSADAPTDENVKFLDVVTMEQQVAPTAREIVDLSKLRVVANKNWIHMDEQTQSDLVAASGRDGPLFVTHHPSDLPIAKAHSIGVGFRFLTMPMAVNRSAGTGGSTADPILDHEELAYILRESIGSKVYETKMKLKEVQKKKNIRTYWDDNPDHIADKMREVYILLLDETTKQARDAFISNVQSNNETMFEVALKYLLIAWGPTLWHELIQFAEKLKNKHLECSAYMDNLEPNPENLDHRFVQFCDTQRLFAIHNITLEALRNGEKDAHGRLLIDYDDPGKAKKAVVSAWRLIGDDTTSVKWNRWEEEETKRKFDSLLLEQESHNNIPIGLFDLLCDTYTDIENLGIEVICGLEGFSIDNQSQYYLSALQDVLSIYEDHAELKNDEMIRNIVDKRGEMHKQLCDVIQSGTKNSDFLRFSRTIRQGPEKDAWDDLISWTEHVLKPLGLFELVASIPGNTNPDSEWVKRQVSGIKNRIEASTALDAFDFVTNDAAQNTTDAGDPSVTNVDNDGGDDSMTELKKAVEDTFGTFTDRGHAEVVNTARQLGSIAETSQIELDKLETVCNEFRVELSEKQSQLNESERKIKDLNESKRLAEEALDKCITPETEQELRARIEKKDEEIVVLKSKEAELEAAMARMVAVHQASLHEADDKLKTQKLQLERRQQEIEQAQGDTAKTKSNMDKLKIELQKRNADLQKQTQTINNLRMGGDNERIEELTATLKEKREQMNKIQLKFTSNQKKLEREIDGLQKKLKEQQEKIHAINADNETIRKFLARSKSEVIALRKQLLSAGSASTKDDGFSDGELLLNSMHPNGDDGETPQEAILKPLRIGYYKKGEFDKEEYMKLTENLYQTSTYDFKKNIWVANDEALAEKTPSCYLLQERLNYIKKKNLMAVGFPLAMAKAVGWQWNTYAVNLSGEWNQVGMTMAALYGRSTNVAEVKTELGKLVKPDACDSLNKTIDFLNKQFPMPTWEASSSDAEHQVNYSDEGREKFLSEFADRCVWMQQICELYISDANNLLDSFTVQDDVTITIDYIKGEVEEFRQSTWLKNDAFQSYLEYLAETVAARSSELRCEELYTERKDLIAQMAETANKIVGKKVITEQREFIAFKRILYMFGADEKHDKYTPGNTTLNEFRKRNRMVLDTDTFDYSLRLSDPIIPSFEIPHPTAPPESADDDDDDVLSALRENFTAPSNALVKNKLDSGWGVAKLRFSARNQDGEANVHFSGMRFVSHKCVAKYDKAKKIWAIALY